MTLVSVVVELGVEEGSSRCPQGPFEQGSMALMMVVQQWQCTKAFPDDTFLNVHQLNGAVLW